MTRSWILLDLQFHGVFTAVCVFEVAHALVERTVFESFNMSDLFSFASWPASRLWCAALPLDGKGGLSVSFSLINNKYLLI